MSNGEVDICNMALGFIGDEATVTSVFPPEGSTQARMCAVSYPFALTSLLESCDWNFASRQVTLSPLDVREKDGWQYAYALPSDCLRVRTVRAQKNPGPVSPEGQTYAPDQWESNDLPYILSTVDRQKVILANERGVLVRYTAKVENTNMMSAQFKLALAYRLACLIVGKRIGGADAVRYAQYLRKEEATALASARAVDASQRAGLRAFIPSWIKGR